MTKLPPSEVDIDLLKFQMKLNNKQLAFMLRVSHRSIDRWIKKTAPQPTWFGLLVDGARASYGGHGSYENLIRAYDIFYGNKRAEKSKFTPDVESL